LLFIVYAESFLPLSFPVTRITLHPASHPQ